MLLEESINVGVKLWAYKVSLLKLLNHPGLLKFIQHLFLIILVLDSDFGDKLCHHPSCRLMN